MFLKIYTLGQPACLRSISYSEWLENTTAYTHYSLRYEYFIPATTACWSLSLTTRSATETVRMSYVVAIHISKVITGLIYNAFKTGSFEDKYRRPLSQRAYPQIILK